MAFIGKFIRDLLQVNTAPDDIGIEVQRKDSPTQTEFIEKQDFLKEVNQGLDDHIADIDDPHESMRVVESKPTGLWDGGELNIVNGTFIEVVAGAGMVIDSYTDPYSKPTSTIMRWQTFNEDIIGSDVAGSVVWMSLRPTTTPAFPNGFAPELVQRTTWPTPENMRDEIYLGVVLHNGDAWGEISSPIVVNNAAHTLDEFLNRVVGPTFVVEGGGFTEAAEHKLDQAAGVIWELNRNWHINKKNPHRENIAGGLNRQFKYVNRDFTEVSALTDTIEPDFWDNDGTVEQITGSGNRTTIQRLYLDPADNLWILWGQTVYNNFNLALALIGADTANTTVPALCQASVLMGYIVSESGKNDWDINESRYIAQNGVSAPSGGAPPITDHALLTGLDVYPAHPALAVEFSPAVNNPSIDVQNAIEYNSNLLAAGITQFSAIITDDAGLGNEWTDLNATDFTGHPHADAAIPTALSIQTTDLVNFYHKGVAYAWVGAKPVTVGVGGNYTANGPNIDLVPTGVGNHPDLLDRDTLDSHPSSAITDLVEHYNDSDIHEEHSNISVIAGAGLVGGGAIDATRTVNIGSPSVGLTINADDIAVNFTPISIPDDGAENVAARSDHLHDGRYYTEAEIDAIMDALGLDGLNDVTVTSPGDGQKLTYDYTTGQWINTTTLEHLNLVFYGYTLTIPPTTDPEPGHVSRNANAVDQVTELYVNKFDTSGKDVSTYWTEIDEGDLFGYWSPDATIKEVYRAVGNAVLSGDIWTIPVEWTNDSGGDLLNGDPIRFLWRVTPNADTMIWKGVWNGDQYLRGDTVYDDGYAMVANKTTTERAAPQPAGEEQYLYNGGAPTTTTPAKVLLFGTRYQNDAPYIINGYRVYAIAGNEYRVFVDLDGVIREIVSFTAANTGWRVAESVSTIVSANSDLIIFVKVLKPADVPATFTLSYSYATPNNAAIPVAGQITHANKVLDSFRVNKTDQNGDQAAQLALLEVGDTIEGAGVKWAIQVITDMGTWIDYTVAPAQQGNPDGVQDFVFETIIEQDIVVMNDPNYWDITPQVSGVYQQDQLPSVETQDAYGLDVLVQHVSISEDWELLSSPGGSGGGGSGGEGTSIHNELEGRGVADTHPITAITNLSSELSGKSDTSHNHDSRYTQTATVDADNLAQNTAINANTTLINEHKAQAVGAHAASAISYDDALSGIGASEVQQAIDIISADQALGVVEFSAITTAPNTGGDIWTNMNANDWTGHDQADPVVTTALRINLNEVMTCGNESGVAYRFLGDKTINATDHRLIGLGALAAGFADTVENDYIGIGTNDHNILTNTDLPDQHTIGSMTGLQAALDDKEAYLGLPSTNGWVLSSDTFGLRTWIAPDTGEKGDDGIDATVSIFDTRTLAAGTPAEAIDADPGNPNNLSIDFGIPQGGKGDTGAQGDQGDPGETGDQGVPGNDGAKGDPGDPGAKGDDGEQGIQGDQGVPGDIGPEGPSTPSANAQNILTLGSDDLLYLSSLQKFDPNAHEHTMSEITNAGTMALVNDAPSDGKGYVRKNTGSGNIWTPEAAENLFTGYKNILMNGDFRVDQFNAYANNGWNIGVGGIGPDRWRKISETQIRQVVEKGSYEPNVPYTLSASGVFIRTETSPPEGTDWYVDVDINAIYIQLERGEFVTDWEYRPYPLELLMCQRYRVYWTDQATGWAYNDAGALRIWADFNFPCRMRATPVILRQSNAVYSNASGATSSSNTVYARVMATVTATGQWYARSSVWKYDAEFDT